MCAGACRAMPVALRCAAVSCRDTPNEPERPRDCTYSNTRRVYVHVNSMFRHNVDSEINEWTLTSTVLSVTSSDLLPCCCPSQYVQTVGFFRWRCQINFPVQASTHTTVAEHLFMVSVLVPMDRLLWEAVCGCSLFAR